MKILVVTHYYAEHGGGIELVARHLLLAMRLVAPDILFTWAATDCEETRLDLPGVTYLPMTGSNIVERKTGVPVPVWWPKALAELAQAVRSHDGVWLHDTLYWGNIAAYLYAKIYRKPIIITQHIGAVPYRSGVLRRLVAFCNRVIATPMLRHATQAVFIAAHVQAYFTGLAKTWRQPPQFVPNGVQHTVFRMTTGERRGILRERFGLRDDPALLFVGRFVEKKGLPILEKLVAAQQGCDWIFAGKGPLDPALWRARNIMVRRDRHGAGLAEFYQAADLLVLPSTGEGLPLVMQEAAACGLPILCAPETAQADPGLQELLYTAPVDAANPEATAQNWQIVLTGLLADPDALAERGRALAAYAQKTWNWTQAAETYAGFFRKAAQT